MKNKIFTYFLVMAAVLVLAGAGSAQQKFIASLDSKQETPAGNSTARAVCVVTLLSDNSFDVSCDYWGLSGNLTLAEVRINGIGFGGPFDALLCNLQQTGGTSGSFYKVCTTGGGAAPLPYEMRNRWLYIELNGEIQGTVKVVTIDNDADGDGRSDLFVFRPSEVRSYVLCSVDNSMMTSQFHGNEQDNHPMLADFDGDGMADLASIHADPATGAWTTVYAGSRDNVLRQVKWGNENTDIPALGDYDRDAKIDIAVFRSGVWYILQSSDGQPRYDYWGKAGDRPCPGDYDRDGKTDLCVVRDEDGQLAWYVQRSSDGQYYKTMWGLSTDTIFPDSPGDFDSDGASDIMVMRNENGQRTFYALRSSDNGWFVQQWGLQTDRPKIGYFSRWGRSSFAAIRETGQQMTWYVSSGMYPSNSASVVNWGMPGDR